MSKAREVRHGESAVRERGDVRRLFRRLYCALRSHQPAGPLMDELDLLALLEVIRLKDRRDYRRLVPGLFQGQQMTITCERCGKRLR